MTPSDLTASPFQEQRSLQAPALLDALPESTSANSTPANKLRTLATETYLIGPTSGWKEELKELWHFRDLFFTLAERDIKLRYKQTLMGVAWVVIQPLLGALMFAFVFGTLAKFDSEGCPYILFAFVGMSAWNLFISTLNRIANSLVGNSALVSKVYFPRLLLPMASIPSAALDYGVALTLALGMMAWYHRNPGWSVLSLPFWICLLLALATGIGLFTAALTVSYRDVGPIVSLVMQLMMWGSPVAYALTNVPVRFRSAYMLNPLAVIFEGFRWSMLGSQRPDLLHIGYSVVLAVLMVGVGSLAFKRMESRFADII